MTDTENESSQPLLPNRKVCAAIISPVNKSVKCFKILKELIVATGPSSL